MLIRLEDGREKDVAVTEVTAQNYICPDNERGIWHAIIEVRKFDPNTGARMSRPRVQKFDDKCWRMVKEQLRLQGYTVTILHDPTQYIAEQADKAKNAEKARREAQQDAINKAVSEALAKQAEQQQAAIDAAVAAALAKARKKKSPTTSTNNKG